MSKSIKKNILVSVPLPLLKRLDTAAKKGMRSRTMEVCIRLEQSLKAARQVGGVELGHAAILPYADRPSE